MAWFEDVVIGTRWDAEAHRFTEEEIIAFAREYDPQPFHVDREAARASHFGGIIASGWHTCAIWMRSFVRHVIDQPRPPGDPGYGPSPGFLDLRWPQPVRPGDEIAFSGTVIEKLDLASRPQWGLVRHRAEGVNQNGTIVLSFIAQGLVPKRNATTETRHDT